MQTARSGASMESGTRDELLGRLTHAVESVTVAHPTRVAIDGPPASGKTTLADELAVVLRGRGRNVIRATIDDFVFPRAQRYRRGEYSAEGCYLDAHDTGALKRVLLDPLGLGGDRRFLRTIYDHASDTALSHPLATAPSDAVLRYIPAQRLYFTTARPADHANIVVHNDEPQQPAWETRETHPDSGESLA
jgi:uridine kinase